ncbi:MAG: glycerol-3-phosphate dehydrogenase/oxidase [Deltaproteobacteria bacterium]|nr:glycerol-3-phosphate dehydrogenase/oxidase [Deltaproteobacteria bacterium]
MPTDAALSTLDREAVLGRLAAGTFDCVVIGGGITGAGVARAAAIGGLSVALIEADDFAAGTSSRSSKLLHGGLRYLAHGDIALVRETALERREVHRIAPHLAEPCWMLVPARSRAGLLKFRAGLGTYEALGAIDEADRHRSWDSAELSRNEPVLRRDRTPFACLYREYLTDDARLVLANLRDARRHGAEAVSHARAVSIVREGERAVGVVARCGLSGREVHVRARCLVNAAGPWVEAVRRLENAAAPSLLHLSNGIHVVLPAHRVPVRHIVVMTAADRRSIFVVPRGDIVYVGTTDTSYTGATAIWPAITRADVEYLLEPLPRVFDVEPVRPEECVAAWGGLRPLIAQPGKRPTEISRRDEIWIGPAGVLTIAGGKLTGYRKMAANVVERVAKTLGATLREEDRETPLPGGDLGAGLDALASALARSFALTPLAAARLARLYGSEAESVAKAGPTPILPGGRVLAGEIAWAVDEEGAATVTDVLYRRTRAALYEPGERTTLVRPVAERMAARLGWSEGRFWEEIATTMSALGRDLEFRTERS